MEKTTIQISSETLDRLKMLKKYTRESYNEVLNEILDETEEETLSDEEIREIQKSLEDVKKGRVYPIEKIAKEFGVILK